MKKENRIAIVGMSCRYPGADNPQQLWENILHGRRSFRQIPEKRLGSSYFSENGLSPDTVYSRTAALLKNYQFDRNKFNVSKNNYQTADLAHWLALDVAAETLANASLGNLLPEIKERTGVIIGNTLTGEQTRANLLRLRWPYVAASVSASLKKQNWEQEKISDLLHILEEDFKKPFPEMEEDSLAGGLSNTIAGRICNYFDFKGGGFTIDGACSSSLLAIAKACDAIANKDLVVALAGGVDISLDPFELVGFSRTGALAKKEMLVYDRDANGFWPGEGCGFTLLADYDFARENKLNILAIIKGWGISSDGKGGLTRPEVNGQCLALKRAYEKANYGIETVAYLEGHGTGTQAGDMAELSAILKLLSERKSDHPVYIGSVKANIGHTKAAAGIAGFIKAVQVLQNRMIPPATGNNNPHPLFRQQKKLQLPSIAAIYDKEAPLRAGVSSMGFGGINTHITIEEYVDEIKISNRKPGHHPLFSQQDTELFLFAEPDMPSLQRKLNDLGDKLGQLSYDEMTDLSCTMYKQLQPHPCRAAIEAATPWALAKKVRQLLLLISEKDMLLDMENGIYFSCHPKPLRIGFLFPGQGNDIFIPGGLLGRRFPFLNTETHSCLKNDYTGDDLLHTNIAQPAVVATSLTAIKALEKMAVRASVAAGHSVGELTAMTWAGMLTEKDVMELVSFRGKLMHDSAAVKGGMISVKINQHEPLLDKLTKEAGVSVACINSPLQTVLSGSKLAIEKAADLCRCNEIPFAVLKVENAFHSALMQELKKPFSDYLSSVHLSEASGKIFSTVSGQPINKKEEVVQLLERQLNEPVLFYKAFSEAAGLADLWIEAGAGNTLTNMVRSFSNALVCPLDFSGRTVLGFARLAGTMFVCGNEFNSRFFFEDRFYRHLNISDEFSFIESPCEQVDGFQYEAKPLLKAGEKMEVLNKQEISASNTDIDFLFREALGQKLGLSPSSFRDGDRMLNDFHLNSLFVGQFLSEFAVQNNLAVTDTPMEYSNASISEVVQMFRMMNPEGDSNAGEAMHAKKAAEPEGIEAWVRGFEMTDKEQPLSFDNGLNKQVQVDSYITCGDMPVQLHRPHTGAVGNINKNLVVFLYYDDESEVIKILLQGISHIKNQAGIGTVLFFQDRPLATGFAKSLFLELKGIDVTVITTGKESVTDETIAAELDAAKGFTEIQYKNGRRFTKELMPATYPEKSHSILPGANDVVLVTGGARGISLECVRALGMGAGCAFILTGRSDTNDAEVDKNLASLRAADIRVDYYTTDITDRQSVSELFNTIRQKGHTITGIIHAAGINKPVKIFDLTEKNFTATVGPKVTGLQNILDTADMGAVKFCISFGSIIGKTGMEGNADYALANEWLDNEMGLLAMNHPETKFLNLQWSVWGGTGMGQKLGVLELLRAKGIEPISLDSGINFFINTLKNTPVPNSIVVTGRYGKISTIKVKQQEGLPVRRFIENIPVHYPGTEIIAECSLSPFTDLYLRDHTIDGSMLWPAVFGMEAMVQAVSFLTGTEPAYIEIQKAGFLHPIVVGDAKEKRIRIIAQHKEGTVFQAAIRDESSGFRQDHFRALINISSAAPTIKKERPFEDICHTTVNVEKDLYGNILFHAGMFRQVHTYCEAGPYKCAALAGGHSSAKYFSDFFPQQLLLGNPLLNDAALHAVQVCVPDKTLLPVSIDKILFLQATGESEVVITAEEKENRGDDYTYNIKVTGKDGQVLQVWESVLFRAMHSQAKPELPLSLAAVALQRKVDLITGRHSHSSIGFNLAIENGHLLKRTDGKPLAVNGYVSRSNSNGNTMLAEADEEITCDMEAVEDKPDGSWQLLFSNDREMLAGRIRSETREDFCSSATRVWCAMECMRKAGIAVSSPLLYEKTDADGTVWLETGSYKILTWKRTIREQGPSVFAVLMKGT